MNLNLIKINFSQISVRMNVMMNIPTELLHIYCVFKHF